MNVIFFVGWVSTVAAMWTNVKFPQHVGLPTQLIWQKEIYELV